MGDFEAKAMRVAKELADEEVVAEDAVEQQKEAAAEAEAEAPPAPDPDPYPDPDADPDPDPDPDPAVEVAVTEQAQEEMAEAGAGAGATDEEGDEDEDRETDDEAYEEAYEEAPPKLYPAPMSARVIPMGGPIGENQLANPAAAMFFLKADKTDDNATWLETIVDQAVQFGQPYPAITHCEMWIGERAGMPSDDNHFSTYLGSRKGAMWTSSLAESARFYGCNQPTEEDLTRRMARSSWSAIPIFAVDGAQRLRRECNLHAGTPYPSSFLLWQYPMSTWPLRAFSGVVDDKINAPAHCAALSARILRTTLPETHTLAHPSHWYGPSSLYLELASPRRMEQSLAREQPTVRAQVQEEELDQLADTLVQHSDDEVTSMRPENAHKALRQLAIHVLRAGSRTEEQEVDQDDFREAQERYAFGLCRYTWKFRKGQARL